MRNRDGAREASGDAQEVCTARLEIESGSEEYEGEGEMGGGR